MSAKNLIVQKPVKKSLLKLPVQVHKKIIIALSAIKQNPMLGIKLHGELAGYYKFRVGDYRIVYKFNISTSILEIVRIEHRQGVYR